MAEGGGAYVPTDDARLAVSGREGEVLSALGLRGWERGKHIRCPYPAHGGDDDWRWNAKEAKAFCTCLDKPHSIFDVVSAIEGIDFEASKTRIAQLLGSEGIIRRRSAGPARQATNIESLLNAPREARDDTLPLAYLAHRLGVTVEMVPRPRTSFAGMKGLGYYDPPATKRGKPVLVGEWPCAVFATVAADGRHHGHRIYLAPGGAGKAELGEDPDGKSRDPKKSCRAPHGVNVGGCAVLWGDPERAERVFLAEGIETAAAVALAFADEVGAGKILVAAAIHAAGVEAFAPWPAASRVTVAADRDEGIKRPGKAPTRRGERAARVFASRNTDRSPSIALPGRPGEACDWLDILVRDGAAAVRAGIQAAAPFLPTAEEVEAADIWHDERRRKAEVPVIRLGEMGFLDTSAAAWRAVRDANEPDPSLFRHAGGVSRLALDENRAVRIERLDRAGLRHEVARRAQWLERGFDGSEREVAPPGEVIEDMLAHPDPPLPPLVGIVTAPVFAPDGHLADVPGYHPGTRLVYVPTPGFSVPPVPSKPSSTDVELARHWLEDELLSDFPFDGPEGGAAERAHALVMLLQAVARPLIDGATPIFLIDKPAPGSGAGLLVNAVSIVGYGEQATAMTEARDDDEMRKRLTAALASGAQLLFLDNVTRVVDSGALASAITAPFWTDRVLGETRMVRLPVRVSWAIAGNNVRVSSEIARRCVRIRLDPRTDRPEERSGWRHENLLAWASGNRDQLVWACLVLVANWLAAGRPPGRRVIGSFESWCQVMGGILDAASIPGFLGNLGDMRERANEEGAGLAAFVSAWWERYGSMRCSSNDLFEIALTSEPLLPLGHGPDRSQRTKLGKIIAGMRDRYFRIDASVGAPTIVHIVQDGVSHHARQWALREREGNVKTGSPVCSPSQVFDSKGLGNVGNLGNLF